MWCVPLRVVRLEYWLAHLCTPESLLHMGLLDHLQNWVLWMYMYEGVYTTRDTLCCICGQWWSISTRPHMSTEYDAHAHLQLVLFCKCGDTIKAEIFCCTKLSDSTMVVWRIAARPVQMYCSAICRHRYTGSHWGDGSTPATIKLSCRPENHHSELDGTPWHIAYQSAKLIWVISVCDQVDWNFLLLQ